LRDPVLAEHPGRGVFAHGHGGRDLGRDVHAHGGQNIDPRTQSDRRTDAREDGQGHHGG
jgi:hypothetical protein